MKKTHLTAAAQKVYDSLTNDQQATIQKEYPFKGDRDNLLRELKARKVSNSVLVELSGLSETQIQRLLCNRKAKRKNINDLLKKLKPYEDLISALNEFIKNM